MVRITYTDRDVLFEPVGWSRIWTLRGRIRVPRSAIRAVRRAPREAVRGLWKGWRLPGTHLPGVIVAGSYYRDGGWDFWDVRAGRNRAIEIDLDGGPYRRLIVDVADPDAEIERLQAAMAQPS